MSVEKIYRCDICGRAETRISAPGPDVRLIGFQFSLSKDLPIIVQEASRAATRHICEDCLSAMTDLYHARKGAG